MIAKLDLTLLAGLLSDASRVAIMTALLDGRALTARELAHAAGVSPQTASFHLSKLHEAKLLDVSPQGRHRYYRIASTEISVALQTIMQLVPDTTAKPAAKTQRAACFARTCYGHLAGYLGVAVAEALEEMGTLRRSGEENYLITDNGIRFLADLGVDYADIKKSRRRLASQCLDWSERRPHVGGSLGFALTNAFKKSDWIKTKPKNRDITVTANGKREFMAVFQIDAEELRNAFFNEQQ